MTCTGLKHGSFYVPEMPTHHFHVDFVPFVQSTAIEDWHLHFNKSFEMGTTFFASCSFRLPILE